MAFNFLPTSTEEIEKSKLKYKDDAITIFEYINTKYKNDLNDVKNPLSFDLNSPKSGKVIRLLQYKPQIIREVNKISKNIKWNFGDGSRGGKGMGNTGLQFENIFKKKLELYKAGEMDKIGNEYKQAIDKIYKILPEKTFIKEIVSEGALNQNRPIHFNGKKVIIGNGDINIGKLVTDITLKTNKGDFYLSLKKGNIVTFANIGIKKLYTINDFKNKKFQPQMASLLDLLLIDHEKFADIFNNYKKTTKKHVSEKNIINVDYRKNPNFFYLLKTGIGYGYIMVHQKTSGIEIHNFDKTLLNSIISGYQKAEILYPKNGTAKRIDIKVYFSKMLIKINIRNKQGGNYPSHLLLDYLLQKKEK